MTVPSDFESLLPVAARFAAHPGYPAAMRRYAEGLTRFREAPRLLNVLVSTDVRWRILGILLYLQADEERYGPGGGATYGRLLDICTQRREANPRVVKTFLALLQLSGLVRKAASATDGRVSFYRSTGRMDEFVRDWMRYATAALDLVDPGGRRGSLVEDPAFARAFSVSGGRAYLEDPVPLAERSPQPLRVLGTMTGGHSVTSAVLLAGLDGVATPSRHEIARRYGLSRSQVDLVVRAGSERGLFAADGRGELHGTALLEETYRSWIAVELAFYARHMPARDELLGSN